MTTVDISKFAELCHAIGYFRFQLQWADEDLPNHIPLFARLDDVRLLENRCTFLSENGPSLGLSLSSRSCQRLLEVLHQITQSAPRVSPLVGVDPSTHEHIHIPPYYFEILRTSLSELYNRLKDELSTSTYVRVRSESAALISETHSFGENVASRFPCLIYDINEGSKCFALGRYTASAFHFLRCFEAGIYALTRCLQIPDPTRAQDRSWGALLLKIREEMQRRWPVAQGRTVGDAALFDQIVVTLASIQNPWRNATMHLENRYAEEEANEIMTAARRFLQLVANRMDEDGNPLA